MCPVCKEPMLAVELDGIEVDHCLKCLGTWLDRGEIDGILKWAGASGRRAKIEFVDSNSLAHSKHSCPRCQRTLKQQMIRDADHLELDMCPKGHGGWFDQGEMAKLVFSQSPGGMEAAAAFFGELFRSELNTNLKKGA